MCAYSNFCGDLYCFFMFGFCFTETVQGFVRDVDLVETDLNTFNDLLNTAVGYLQVSGWVGVAQGCGVGDRSSWWCHQMETFPRYWPFVGGIHRWPVDSPKKGQWRGTLMFYLICAWPNGWASNRDASDLKRQSAHYDVIVMCNSDRGKGNSLGFFFLRPDALSAKDSRYNSVGYNTILKTVPMEKVKTLFSLWTHEDTEGLRPANDRRRYL